MRQEPPVLASLRRSRRFSPGLAVTTAAVFLAYSTAGCLSHEYSIPKEELARVVEMAPQARGEKVRVVQEIGDRRADRVEYGAPYYGPEYGGPDVHVDLGYHASYSGPRHHHGGPPPGHGTHVVPPAAGGGGRVTPPVGDATPVAGPNGAPVPAKPITRGGGSGGGGLNVGGGGGGGGKDDLAVLAVIVAVAAAFSIFGLAATEGARHDGYIQLHPGQPVHLRTGMGQEKVVALGDLSREDVGLAAEAVVMDDEGYGLRLLERRPLDRVGGTFKMDVGSLGARFDDKMVGGIVTNIQAGFFPVQRFGLLANLSLSGGSDPLGQTFTRHTLSLESQFFPLKAGPVHFGLFGNVGSQLITQADLPQMSGLALGGGLLVELELTTRMALTLRGGWTSARADGDRWLGTGAVALGIAVY